MDIGQPWQRSKLLGGVEAEVQAQVSQLLLSSNHLPLG